MSEKHERLLLLDDDSQWAERFVNALQVRGWNISWSESADTLYTDQLYSVYLINLSLNGLDPREACDHIRALPKGENASIFLLNGGHLPLKSFEEALAIGADGLYFHKTQMPLLLANFPPKTGGANRGSNRGDYLTLSSRHFGAGITLGGVERSYDELESTHENTHLSSPAKEDPLQTSRKNRVAGMSLGYRNRQRLSQEYSSEGLSVSDIEAALADVDRQSSMGKQSSRTPMNGLVEDANSGSMTPPLISPHPSPRLNRSTISDKGVLTPMMTLGGVQPTPQSRRHSSNDSATPIPNLPWGERLTLYDRPFAEYFAHIISHRLSLVLSIKSDSSEYQTSTQWLLAISEGEIVYVRSSDLCVSLVNQLISNASLSQMEAEAALKALATYRGHDPVDALIEALLELSPSVVDHLDDAMEHALLKVIYRLFEVRSGILSVEAYQRPTDLRRFKLSSIRILLNGIRESMGKLKLYKVFGTPKEIPFVGSSNLFDSSLTERERVTVNGAQGHRTINELSEDSGLSVFDTLSLCYAFSLLGELTLNKESPLRHFFQRASSEDYYQLLSLDYEAKAEEIIEAWRSHRQWLAEQRGDQELVTPLIDIINDAYCVLAHPPLRVRYLNSLSKPLYSEKSIIPESYDPAPPTKMPT